MLGLVSKPLGFNVDGADIVNVGLALQVLERQEKIKDTLGAGALDITEQGCSKWTGWLGTHSDVWKYADQEDSGI